MGCGASRANSGKYGVVPPDAPDGGAGSSPTKQLDDRPDAAAGNGGGGEQLSRRTSSAASDGEWSEMEQRVQKMERENAILKRQVQAFVEERQQMVEVAQQMASAAPTAPGGAPPARGGARQRAPGYDGAGAAPADTAEVKNRLAALEELSKQQHIVWVDKVRPALAWIIDRMQEVHVRVGAEGGTAPPPRTPAMSAANSRASTPGGYPVDARMISILSGTLTPVSAAHKYSHEIDDERQVEIDLAVRRLRDAW